MLTETHKCVFEIESHLSTLH